MKRGYYLVLGLIVAFLGVTFAVKNNQIVTLEYYFNLSWKTSLSLMLLVAFILGLFLGYAVAWVNVARIQRRLAQVQKEREKLEKEVASLRALPIKDAV